jgi:pyruvate dehydrogenase E1 component alpha subunit
MNEALSGIPHEKLISMYELMLKIRLAEEKCIELNSEQLMRSPHHYYIGQEAVGVGVCAVLDREDQVYSSHRSHGHYLAKGGDLNAFFAELYCKIDGCAKGKGGSMHLIDTSVGFMNSNGIVVGTVPMAVGAAFAFKIRKKLNVTVAFFGDGGADQGVLYEALNYAVLKKLPVIFVCENNFFASFSHVSARHGVQDIKRRAEGFGMPAVKVFGQDILEVYTAAQKMVQRAKKGEGPSFIEAEVFRFKGHCGTGDDVGPGLRSQEELEIQKKECPISQFEKILTNHQILDQAIIRNIRKRLEDQVNQAVEFGRNSPLPNEEELLKDVYA